MVAKYGALTTEIREDSAKDAEELGSLCGQLLLGSDVTPSMVGKAEDFRAPMRVVLMGRTMAGKSSIFAALTGSYFDPIGDGRQRYSRDVFGAASTDHAQRTSPVVLVEFPHPGHRQRSGCRVPAVMVWRSCWARAWWSRRR